MVASRNIEIRSSDPNRVEVASGLNPGDVVVTAGIQALRPGQKVRLLESKQ
jgi:multidrug efflux pump subunit AcrA (membrane-fusion protein)